MLTILNESYPIRGAFTISRGTKTHADILCCHINWGGKTGRGECVPYGRYGETPANVRAQIAAVQPLLHNKSLTLSQIHDHINNGMKAGAARNALDCALWDVQSKISGMCVADALSIPLVPLVTAYTISLENVSTMVAQARAKAHFPLLKIKLGSPSAREDIARMEAVREAAPDSRLIVDANEGWAIEHLHDLFAAAAACGVALVEQPLPAAQDACLATITRSVPVCADESLHGCGDLGRLEGRYDAINIKLDKTGGLTQALILKREARAMGFQIMVGSMVATSLAVAPAFLLAQDADFVDLDGPLLLEKDREEGMKHQGATLFPPTPALWG